MKKTRIVKLLWLFTIILLTALMGCKRDTLSPTVPDPLTIPVNDVEQVTASVSGIVLDENNVPIAGAMVTSGTTSANTNSFGMFNFPNISLSKNNGFVTVIKSGYFKGIRSFKTTAGKAHQVRIQLMQRMLSGSVNAGNGGTVNSNGGATISFPANAFVTSAGASYTGTVNVYSRWIDPTGKNLPYLMPGDLRGVATNGSENILVTFGMLGAELQDAAGNTLKLANGKKASISFPIPAAINSIAPATIALWHFDDAAARWKEEGTATKSGNSYTAQVDKFSFWNCDLGISNFVVLDYTLINAAGNTPMAGTTTRIKILSSGAYGYGITNSTGFVSGLVPKNEALVLEVVSPVCGTVVYAQNIGPFATSTSLGNLAVPLAPSQYINFTGKILNCIAAPVANGSVSLFGTGGNSGFANSNSTGDFSFTILNCTGSNIAYSYFGTDNSTAQQSSIATGVTSNQTVNLGNITACGNGNTVDVYVTGFEPVTANTGNNTAKVWKNGVATNLSDGTKNGLAYGVYVAGNDVYVAGREHEINTGFSSAKVWKNGVATILTDGTGYAEANAVFVSGTDVYVAGSDGVYVKLWKNGVAGILSSTGGHASSVFVAGTDVYVAGNNNFSGIVWKNGTAFFTTTTSANFKSIYVASTDVYVVGTEFNGTKSIAKIWKNGVGTNLSDGTTDASANGVFVSGTDVYVVGNLTNPTGFFTVAKLWKNGVATNLTNGNRYGNATGVATLGNDVYVVGSDQILQPDGSLNMVIIVWKNGFPVNITNGTYSAFSTALFVK